jgi:hypothetical protein
LVLAGLLTAFAAIQFRAEPGGMLLHLTILLRKLVDEVSADSGLQLNLEIALSGVSAKMQPHELFSSAEDALKRRLTVISLFLGGGVTNSELLMCRTLPYMRLGRSTRRA